MCTTLENLEKRGEKRSIHKAVTILRELNVDDAVYSRKNNRKIQIRQ